MHLLCRTCGPRVLIVVAVLLAANGAIAAAQVSVGAGPVVAYYLALPSSDAADGPNAPGTFSAPAYGGEVTVWTHARWGMQAQGAIASSHRVEITNPGGWEGALPGQIIIGSVQAMYALDADHPHELWISGGPGLVQHAGDAFKRSGSPTEAAVALGVGSTRAIGDALRMSFGASTLLYRYTGILGTIGGPLQPDGTSATGTLAHRFRSDVLFHISLTWKVN